MPEDKPAASRQATEGIAEVVDLGSLGPPTRTGTRSETGLRVFAPWDLGRHEGRALLADALARQGQSWVVLSVRCDRVSPCEPTARSSSGRFVFVIIDRAGYPSSLVDNYGRLGLHSDGGTS